MFYIFTHASKKTWYYNRTAHARKVTTAMTHGEYIGNMKIKQPFFSKENKATN